MDIIFSGLSKGIASLALGITSFLPFTTHTQTPAVVVTTPVTVAPQEIISIKKTITAMGMTITVDMKAPVNGGPITGTIKGDCDGTISGLYDGPSSQTFTGKGAMSCPVAIFTVDGTVLFDGTLDQDTRKAVINYKASTNTGMSKSGTTTVGF